MTGQGWMVNDGTCLSCLQGQDWLCTKPVESYGDQWDRRTRLLCCCDNGYHVGYLDDLDNEDAEP
jgi:hypothetical protein